MELVHKPDTASCGGEHFFEASLKFLNMCRRYAPDKILDVACPPAMGGNYDLLYERAYKKLKGTLCFKNKDFFLSVERANCV
jgi:hypothetical protein